MSGTLLTVGVPYFSNSWHAYKKFHGTSITQDNVEFFKICKRGGDASAASLNLFSRLSYNIHNYTMDIVYVDKLYNLVTLFIITHMNAIVYSCLPNKRGCLISGVALNKSLMFTT